MDKLKYTVVGIAPNFVQDSLLKLKNHFNLPFDTTEISNHFVLKDNAHYAIKRTFYLKSGVSEEDVVNKIKNSSLKPKIHISCTDTGVFPGTAYGDIVYVKINDNQSLKELHNELRNSLDNFIETKNPEMEGENYIPHLSMAYNVSREITEDVNSYIKQNILPLEFDLKEILLLKDFNTQKDERKLVYTHHFNG